MRLVRSPMSARTIADAFHVASVRLALRANVLDIIRDGIAQVADHDDALLLARNPDWAACCPLIFMLVLRAQSAIR